MWKSIKDSDLIPKEFDIAGSTYKISLVNSEDNLDGALGDFCNLLHRIRIAINIKIDNEIITVPEDGLLKTYLHELGHCFNYYYNNESSEEFANAFANFFYEYIHTKK